MAYRMSRKSMNKLIELCKCHPLFVALNKNKMVNNVKTEKRTRTDLMNLMIFLGTFGEGGSNSNSRNRY